MLEKNINYKFFIFLVGPFLACSEDMQSAGKKRINVASRTHTKTAKAFKPYDLNVYLLDKNSETTPSPAHELKLVQAGLGKRTISIAMDMTHSEVY